MADYRSIREKAERTSVAAAELIRAERQARDEKTERLRKLRLARQVPEKPVSTRRRNSGEN
jgi:hypothetical protein